MRAHARLVANNLLNKVHDASRAYLSDKLEYIAKPYFLRTRVFVNYRF
jgi:hypothetical protein